MTDLSGPVSVTEGSQTITSTSDTAEQLRESMQPEPEPEPEQDDEPEKPPVPRKVSKAAAELGKRGGEASAEARRAAKEAEEDDEPDAVAEAERLEKEGKLGKPRHDPKARMLAATREAKAAREERDALKAREAAARRELEALKAQTAPKPTQEKPAEPAGKPVASDFPVYEDFIEALADWKAETKFKERETKAAQQAAVREYTDRIDSELGQAISARKEYEKTDPGFLSRISEDVKAIANKPSFARDLDEPLEPKHIVSDEIILSKAAGPRLMLHLTDHPEDLQRILALDTPQEIQVEMRLLARTLNGAATTATSPKREVSKAPQPIRPVTGGPHIDGDEEPDDDAPLSAFIKGYSRRELRSTR